MLQSSRFFLLFFIGIVYDKYRLSENGEQNIFRKELPATNQSERRDYLISYLQKEQPRCKAIEIPAEASPEFLKIQDAYLRETAAEKGIVYIGDLQPSKDGIYLWQGDITRLAADAIVNAANSGMTGCYQPNHACIDNCIHTYAGVQLRLACAKLMERQEHEEPTGQAKITPDFSGSRTKKRRSLPCRR